MGIERREKKLKDWLENCLKIGREKQHIDMTKDCFTDIDANFNVDDVRDFLIKEEWYLDDAYIDDNLNMEFSYVSDKPKIVYEISLISSPHTLTADIVLVDYEWEDEDG